MLLASRESADISHRLHSFFEVFIRQEKILAGFHTNPSSNAFANELSDLYNKTVTMNHGAEIYLFNSILVTSNKIKSE